MTNTTLVIETDDGRTIVGNVEKFTVDNDVTPYSTGGLVKGFSVGNRVITVKTEGEILTSEGDVI